MTKLLLTFSLLVSIFINGQSKSVGDAFGNAIITRYQPTINTMTHKDWDHSNSIVLNGLIKLYENEKNPAYLTYIQKFVDEYVDVNGHIESLKPELDGMHPGVLLLYLYKHTGQEKYKKAATQMRNYLIGTKTQKSIFHETPDGGYWHKNNDHYHNVMTIDGAYMSNPFLVQYGILFDDIAAINTATFETLLVASHTFNIDLNLAYHGWDYDKKHVWSHKITGTSTQIWSRSIGWFSMALADILENLPENHKDYSSLLYLYQQLASGIKNHQNPNDGLWYQIVTNPERKGNYPETSGSGMIIYALKKGVDNKWLDNSYQLVCKKGWDGLQKKVSINKDGMPQINSFAPGMGIKNNAEEYIAVQPVSCPSNDEKQHPHGYCAVLMASSVMEK